MTVNLAFVYGLCIKLHVFFYFLKQKNLNIIYFFTVTVCLSLPFFGCENGWIQISLKI